MIDLLVRWQGGGGADYAYFMARMFHVLLCYMVQDNFEDYLSKRAKRGMT